MSKNQEHQRIIQTLNNIQERNERRIRVLEYEHKDMLEALILISATEGWQWTWDIVESITGRKFTMEQMIEASETVKWYQLDRHIREAKAAGYDICEICAGIDGKHHHSCSEYQPNLQS